MNQHGCLWLRLEATANNTPEGVAIEMEEISGRLKIPISVDFNGISMLCFPGDKAADISGQWRRQMNLPPAAKLPR